MANQPLETSLPILIRSCTNRESESSMEVNVSEHSIGSDPILSLPPSRFLSFGETPLDSTGCETPPASPPSDPGPETGNRLIDGVGGHFPAELPSRASTLTMEGDSAANIPVTPRAVPEPLYSSEAHDRSPVESKLDTPRANTHSSKPPLWLAPAGESIFGHVFPLTPGLTPVRKRPSSPPFAPRPAKKPRMDSPPVAEPSEDEAYQVEPRKRAKATAFRSARSLSIDLAGTIGLEMARTEPRATQLPRYVIETEPFAEDEVEQYLAELLGAYRACYPEASEGGTPSQSADPDRAQDIRQTLRALFGHHLKSADDDDGDRFLLQEEEEDVLDAFMTLIRDKQVLSGHQRRATFASLPECLQHLEDLMDSTFVKRVL